MNKNNKDFDEDLYYEELAKGEAEYFKSYHEEEEYMEYLLNEGFFDDYDDC